MFPIFGSPASNPRVALASLLFGHAVLGVYLVALAAFETVFLTLFSQFTL